MAEKRVRSAEWHEWYKTYTQRPEIKQKLRDYRRARRAERKAQGLTADPREYQRTKEEARQAMAAWRAKQRAAGVNTNAVRTPEFRAKVAAYMRVRMREQREAKWATASRPKPKVCEVCNELNRLIVFDHCHVGGHFRGWLCDRCNRILGAARDVPEVLDKLAHYLRQDKTINGNTN